MNNEVKTTAKTELACLPKSFATSLYSVFEYYILAPKDPIQFSCNK